MANLAGKIDYNASPESQFDPLPSGEYLAIVSASECKPTKRGDGEYLELTYQIVDGPYQGRQLWARVTLANPNQTAVQIGQQHLAQLRHATGVLQLTDSQQLHNIPHVIRVEFQPADPAKNRTRDQNEVREYKAMAKPGQAAQPAQRAAPAPFVAPAARPVPAAPAAGPKLPWAQ
jgi:hypothetical protein